MTNNLQKKKQINDTLAKYNARIEVVKARRDKIIFDFLDYLKEKKLEKLRSPLK